MTDGGGPTPAPPPPRVSRPVMYHRWNWITFIHWRYPSPTLQALLPEGLTVETCDGSAWIGLTPFLMQEVRAPALPAVPWLSEFPEINVRTYVRDRRGRSGIWFLSLDAARLPAVLAARAGYGLPYFWSDMRVRVEGDRVDYRCRRRWPGPRGARCDAETRIGPALTGAEVDPLAHFLTARYRLFSRIAGRLVAAEAEHVPWPLHRAELLRLDQDLVTAAGLPAPTGDPLTHASLGVPVRVGMWHP
ncbi:YqjF family protein [Plantactinospora sp. CA-290183]|uniref:YqjF family protein n=1 Tax=Plantactinospora sp. CA-290183 TaxID=3240006 RepID=UPI003D9340C7